MAAGMNFSRTEQTVYDLAVPIAERLDFSVYDVEFTKEGSTRFLRVFLDKEGGIGIDECEEFSRALSDLLDEADPISENYYLEVSSPGIERKIRRREHFDLCRGEAVDVGLYRAVDGVKAVTGELLGLDGDDSVLISVGGDTKSIPLSEVTGIHVHFDF